MRELRMWNSLDVVIIQAKGNFFLTLNRFSFFQKYNTGKAAAKA